MKKTKLELIILVTFILFGINTCNISNDKDIKIDKTFHQVKKSYNDFLKDGYIENIVILETNENSIFGTANDIKIGESGEIYIADVEKQCSIIKYLRDGKYDKKYGKLGQGPGEYNILFSFDVDRNGNVYILARNKIIIYDKSGEFIKEIKINYIGGGIKVIDNKIYVRTYLQKININNRDNMLYIYDYELNLINSLLESDNKLRKYMFLPRNSMTVCENMIILCDVYDLSFKIYNIATRRINSYAFGERNNSITNIWENKILSENEKNIVLNSVNRFEYIYCYGTKLCLMEMNRLKKEYNLWLMDIDKKSINKYPLREIQGNGESNLKGILKFNYLGGTYKNGLIFVVEDKDYLERIKRYDSKFKNIDYNENNNPLLIFYRMKENE